LTNQTKSRKDATVAEELDVARLDRTFAPDRPDDARREIRDATRSTKTPGLSTSSPPSMVAKRFE